MNAVFMFVSLFLGAGVGVMFYNATINKCRFSAFVFALVIGMMWADYFYKTDKVFREFLETLQVEKNV